MSSKTTFKTIFCVVLVQLILLTVTPAYAGNPKELDQTTRLAALGKVWGLLKYYHPEVAKGQIDWDEVLVSAIPAVKAAVDYVSFNREINNLIIQAGDVTIGDYNPQTPAHPNESLFKWIKDSSVFDNEVRRKLMLVQKKHVPAENYYVEAGPAGNTYYFNEIGNDDPLHPYPDENHRLLALYRFWNIIQYFFPYKKDIGEDWEGVLEEYVPRFVNAADLWDYQLTMKEVTVRINDTHGYMYSYYLLVRYGWIYAPVELRYIDGKTIVTRAYDAIMDPPGALRKGDIILKTHETDVDEYRESVRKYSHGSNESAKERIISEYVQMGSTWTLPFTILRDGQTLDVTVAGLYSAYVEQARKAEDLAAGKWKILPGNIGYVNMGALEKEDVDAAMAELIPTRAIIFDLRYNAKSTQYLISDYLNPEPVDFAKITIPSMDYPGEFPSIGNYQTGSVNPDYYKGKVVLLFDEFTQSHGEFVCMALQTAPDVTLIGSQTAGADGNYSHCWLPGYISFHFSGLGIYYPDGTPTQRIGIVPDIVVRPTIQGIRAGRDEVLERAIQFIETSQ